MKRVILAASLVLASFAAFGQTVSLFPNVPNPAPTALTDNRVFNFGIKFSSDMPGLVAGAKFWKIAGEPGTHYARLYTSAGVQLGTTATFTAETASGWQTVSFSPPIQILAGTSYIIAVNHNAGTQGYAGWLTGTPGSAAIDFPPLHKPAGGMYTSVATGSPLSVHTTAFARDVIFLPSLPICIVH